MEQLISAIREARDAIVEGTTPDVALQEAAELYELNPALVRRKFIESYGDPSTIRERHEAGRQVQAEARAARKREVDQVQMALHGARRFSW